MKQTVEIKARVEWDYCRTINDRWVAKCDALRLTVEGDSVSDLAAAVQEAINLLFHDLVEDNELDMFLHRMGWRLNRELPAKRKNINFDVPYDLRRIAVDDLQGAHA